MDSFSQDLQKCLKDFIVNVTKLYGVQNLRGNLISERLYEESFEEKSFEHLNSIEEQFLKLMQDLRKELKHLKLPSPELQFWKFIPMGEDWVDRELQSVQKILPIPGSHQDKRELARKERLGNFDRIRLKFSNQCELHKGLDSLSNYYALVFKDSDFLIFESMEYSNAVYFMRGDWKILSRLTKAELKRDHFANSISHKGQWKSKLNSAIQRNLTPIN